MKTTLDLPEELLMAAKQTAIRRRTTLKELMTRGLQREIGDDLGRVLPPGTELGESGLPRLRKRGTLVTSETIQRLIEDEEN